MAWAETVPCRNTRVNNQLHGFYGFLLEKKASLLTIFLVRKSAYVPKNGPAVTPLQDEAESAFLRYVEGDDGSFDALYPLLEGTRFQLLKMCGDTHLVDDVFQEGFLDLRRSGKKYQPKGRLKAWLASCMRLQAKHVLSHKKVYRKFTTIEQSTEIPDQKQSASKIDNRDEVTHLLGTLPERQRQFLIMRYLDDLKPSEISVKLGVKVEIVSDTIYKGLAKLRKLFTADTI